MKRDIDIERILRMEGPCLSSRLCSVLESRGLNAEAARQRISRAPSAVKRLAGLIFPRNVRFLYHELDFNSAHYWHALVRDIEKASPAYTAAIAALRARGGIVPLRHFPVVCGAPVLQRGQLASQSVLERLLHVRVLKEVDVPAVGRCIAFDANGHLGGYSQRKLKARLLTEGILLLAVRDWARNLGVISFDKVAIRDEDADLPKVGTFHWDLAGPSYLRPLARRDRDGKLQPGFVVCDAIVGQFIDKAGVAAFVRKVELVGYLPNLASILPLLVVDHFEAEAFRLARSRGVIAATPESLFGREVAQGLGALLKALTSAGEMASKNPDIIDEVFRKLGRIEGAATNLRGALFEMLVGHCVQQCEDGLIDIGKTLRDPESMAAAEADVFRIKERREVWCYECRGYQPAAIIDFAMVEEWLTKKVPVMHGALRGEERFQGCRFHFSFWTTGIFAPDALTFLKDAAERTKRYSVEWKDGVAVKKYASKLTRSSVPKILDEHFFRHPLAEMTARRDPGPAARRVAVVADSTCLSNPPNMGGRKQRVVA